MKKAAFVLYAWGSTFLFAAVIYWLATLPYLSGGERVMDELIKVIFRLSMYAILFILFYRSCIITLKTTVERLSKWRSKKEEMEDTEFVLIIETMIVIITILATILFSIFEEYTQFVTGGSRVAEVKDILISVMAALLTAIVVYSMPVIGELEVAIKHKFDEGFVRTKKK